MKKVLIIGILLLLVFGFSCGSQTINERGSSWGIVQSPITGRYYEVREEGARSAMSEVTQIEYEHYLAMIGEK